MTTESKRLKEEAKKFGVSVPTYALATLMAAGWTAAEAYALAYYENASLSASQNANTRDHIVQNPNFAEMVKKIRTDMGMRPPILGNVGLSGQSLPSKDDVAQIIAQEMFSLSGKEKVDAAMKLADLFAMKKEETKEDSDIVRVWLPLTCYICPYKQRADEKGDDARQEE